MVKLRKFSLVILLPALFILLSGCDYDDREFLPDITVPLKDGVAEIVIREWRLLLGSGAEIYYKQGYSMTLLGKTTGGDDGYCPFAEGKYAVTLDENSLLVRWHFGGDVWKEARFSLPGQDG